ncbi:carbohydrate ABC transporter permease [Paenibacillus flagellatus]|uniref:Carbohydrate ABC transporter permease n=1 Tax=Paenibacillus flagellatus TaxID=2211139 RepID=A0A2V5KVU6_9BACL|nr:carbohydrate ABC transporter permease [Paenibacillus flagellatus]PYI56307.1 carbohydrate ABC transporter permease [Paenibacillus flagellatus]
MPVRKRLQFFPIVNGAVFVVICLTMIAPIVHLAAVSFSSPLYANAKLVTFWPKGFNIEVYKTIFGMDTMWRSMGNSIVITVVGTLIALAFTSTLAYSLSRPQMKGRKWVLRGIIVTFVFSAPLIPNYLLVRGLGMENTLWALMVPGALGAFNVVIMKTFFQGISSEMFDAAKIDGCSELGSFARIAIPLSMPVIATIALFHAVGQWNSYFSALIFIRSKELMPMQVVLRSLVVEEQANNMASSSEVATLLTPEMLKAGITLFATAPILIVYPFLQKYFVKGAMVGSLKE